MTTILSPEIEATYEVLQTMGGGMGAVYKVRHRLFGEIRIIKVMQAMLADNQALRDRFCAEARRGKQLEHRNIAKVLDFQIGSNGNPHLFMEYIDGITVHEYFVRSGGPLDPPTVVMIGVQTLAALDYLHSRNLVHRDISPDNLMITRELDGSPVIKLIDLGIAKSLQETAIVTRTGSFMGKITYASPEQSGGVVDARSDFYSLGVVLYELLTAAKPITGANTAALLIAHHQKPPRPFSETDPKGLVPEELRRVVLKALEKRPENRYQTATEFAAALQDAVKGDRTASVMRTATMSTPPPDRPAAPPYVAAPRPYSAAPPQYSAAPPTVRMPAPAPPVVFVPGAPLPIRASGSMWFVIAIAVLAAGMIAFAGVATLAKLKGSGRAAAQAVPNPPPLDEPAGSTMAVEAAPPLTRTTEPSAADHDLAAVAPVVVEEQAASTTTPSEQSTATAPPNVVQNDPSLTATTTALSSPVEPQPQPRASQPADSSATPLPLRSVGRDLSEGDRRRQEALAFSTGRQWENAVIAWRQFIRDYSGINAAADHAAWYNLGVALEELRQWKDAVDAFEHASTIDWQKNDTNNLLRLARCYGKLGRWSDAAVTYQRVLKSDPTNDIARRSLLYIQQQETRASLPSSPRRP